MKINTTTFEELHRPVYILEEAKLRNNLSLISSIAKEADIEIILAFKAYALWKTFPIFREYINATTASSLYETKLGYNEFGAPTHTFSPAYTDYEIDEIAQCSSHLVFNSLSQFNRFHLQSKQANSNISIGLRVNPEYSEVETLPLRSRHSLRCASRQTTPTATCRHRRFPHSLPLRKRQRRLRTDTATY